MRTWRDLRRAQRSGEAVASPDPWAWMLAGDSKPGVHPKHQKFLEFQAIVENILSEDTDNDWPSIQRDCPDCRSYGGSPWDHYVYHRRGNHQTVSAPAVGAGDAGERDDTGKEDNSNQETEED